MNVLTTTRRIDYFIELFGRVGLGTESMGWLEECVLTRHGKYVATMPADAWHLLAELMRDDVFGPRGFARPKTQPYKLKAMREVQEAVNLRRIHPAIKGRVVIGQSVEIVTAWYRGGFDTGAFAFRREAPDADNLSVGVPTQLFDYTSWKWLSDAGDLPSRYARLCEKEAHIAFCIEVQAHR